MIVDTPGMEDRVEKGVVEKMMEYLPNALAFVFVVNAAAAGGLQNDRVLIIISCIISHDLYKAKNYYV